MKKSHSIYYKHPTTVTFLYSRAVNKRVFAVIRFLVLAALAGPASADVTCSVSSSGVSFGSYDVFSAVDNDAAGDIGVSCTGLTDNSTAAYEILLSTGGGSYVSRLMASESNYLAYNLYTNSSYSTIWGDNSTGTDVISDSYSLGLTTVTNNYSVYGRIPAGQNVLVGSYSDMLIVTVNY